MPNHDNDRGHDPVLTFAQVEVGNMLIGIQSEYVVRALPRPRELARLPRSHGAIEGVFRSAGQVIPLVELRNWMGGAPAAPAAQVLVLGAQDRTVGLAVDAIRGLLRLPASRIRRVHHDESEDDFFHSVATLDDSDGLISLLDPMRLMLQANAWTCNDALAADTAAEASGSGISLAAAAWTAPQALLRLGATVLAIPATQVGEVVRQPTVQPLALGASLVAGVMVWRDRHVPVVDAARALGLAESEAGTRSLTAVLTQGERCVGLPVDEVLAVRPLDKARMVGPEHAGLDTGGPFTAVTGLDDDKRVLLIDTDWLLEKYAAAGLSTADAAQTAGRGRGADANAQSYVVFDAGGQWAIPMAALQEIMPVPTNFDPAPANGHGVAGTFEWRSRALPIIDMPDLDSHAESAIPLRLMVMEHEGRYAGLRVNDVVALVPARGGTITQFRRGSSAPVRIITIGRGIERKSYRILDFGTLPFFTAPAVGKMGA